MNVLTFWVDGRPVPKQRARTVTIANGKRMSYTPKRTRAWERCIKAHALKARAGGWKVDVARYEVDIIVHRARRQGDADNFEKACLDACNNILWPDDRYVMRVQTSLIDGEGQGMRVRVTRTELPTVGPISEPNLTGAE